MNALQRLLQGRTAAAPRALRFEHSQEAERDAQAAEAGDGGGSGHDFSAVRIHSDPQAGEVVEQLGARALTFGRDIFVAPGRFRPSVREGRQLLAHEMRHVTQQSSAAEPSVQFSPDQPRPGIGASPPDTAFIRMKTRGAEKGFVLFARDDATPPGGHEKKLLALLEGYTEAVLVELHGYASEEGPEEYNVNLSAHRAVAVKGFLEPHLPPGSRVDVFAHGESREFGLRANNRRVGVWVGAKPAEAGFKPKLDLDLRLRLGEASKPRFDLPALPPTLVPRPPWERDQKVLPSLRFDRVLPRLGDRFQVDWRAVSEPGAYRGQSLTGRDVAPLEETGRSIYENLYQLGLGHDLAQWWANRVLISGYEARLALEHPSLLDLSESEMRKLDPEFRQTVVPVITPDTLNWVIKKTFKKDVEFRF